ncbi:MAG: tRNA-specific adenosine deaminase [Epulopiscium sp. Nele67-Bin005]|nr:MAG: tRNA-specific adenosine deaminase [Epulopiscium sp. Nele67-Bin005]
MDKHIFYMNEALIEADKAFMHDETPIGAIIVHKDKIIGRGCNLRNTKKNPLAHAEIIAINEAAQTIGDWRLEECTLYVTLEPCPMCSGAIVQARIPTIVFGANSPKSGFGGSILNIFEMNELNHRCEVIRGICEEEAMAKLKKYFKMMRQKSKKTTLEN